MLARCTLLFMILLAGSAHADDLAALKSRMKARQASIEDLLVRKVVGENKDGFLEFRGDSRDKEGQVKGENADRSAVYRAIAAKTGTSVESVGARRAQAIRGIASPGTMVQDPDGIWREKQ
ncbi:MAG: hypothetical protein ACI8W8_000202 [Rhodothermales bacterium]|jgi:uncharacterized protein YdbL (DUF1318 family)